MRHKAKWIGLLGGMAVLCSVAVASPDEARLSVGFVRGYPGVTVSVPLTYRQQSNMVERVVAVQADIGYEFQSLLSGPATPGPALQGQTLGSSLPLTGTRRVLIYSMNHQPLTNRTIAHLPFTISAGTYTGVLRLSISNVVLSTAQGNDVVAAKLPGAVIISPVYITPEGNVNLFVDVTPDQPHLVQASGNLVHWTTIGTDTPATAILEFVDTEARQHPMRFYRAIPAP